MTTDYQFEARRVFGPSARIVNNGRYAAVSRCAYKPLVYLFIEQARRDAKLLEWRNCNCCSECGNAHYPKDFAETTTVPVNWVMAGVGDWHD